MEKLNNFIQNQKIKLLTNRLISKNNYYDSNGHGTVVAGVIAALLNSEGLAGIAPSVELYSVKIMQSSSGFLSDAISGIEWTIDNNINIVSMSFGFNSYSQIFKEILEEAYANNILLVAASGNEGTDNILYPAAYDSVIAVGATTENDNLAYFSSYGFEQELVAPGVDINSTSLGNSYGLSSGTSLAAPHVAGVAALIKSFNNSLTNEQIRAKLRNDALDLGEEGKDDMFGYGLVQANLEANNFTFVNESYFYEIFNISDYGFLNITYNFWINGTGTIDDVTFLLGYYLINITFSDGSYKARVYNVSENSSFWVLSTTITHTDDFQTESGTIHDNVAWFNDGITVKTSSDVNTPEGECYKIDSADNFNYCFFDTSGHQTECDSSPDITCGGSTTCSVDSLLEIERDILNDASARSGSSVASVIDDCTFAGTYVSSDTIGYYVEDKKRIRCTNTSGYVYEGHYGSGNWISYGSGICSGSQSLCQDSSNFTTETATMPNPCVNPNTCTGIIQTITEDRNGNPMQGLLVNRDSVSNKTTNSVGVAEYSLSKTCFEDMEFRVYCSNSSSATLCDTKTAKLDTINDYEGLLFGCSSCSGSPDIQIAVNDIRASKEDDLITVNLSLASSFTATNVNITFKVQDGSGLIVREASQLFNINAGESFKSVTRSVTLNGNDEFVHVYADAKQTVSESNEKNNYALVPLFQPEITAYLNITTGYPLIDQEIKDYLKLFVIEKPQSQAKVTIAVGLPNKNIIINSKNSFTRTNYKWWFEDSVKFNGAPLGIYPYNGLVGGFKDDYNYIFVVGNDIDGLLAAVKRLVSARSLFLSNFDLHRVKVIDNNDIAGISVADLLRNPSNYPYYNQRNSVGFANVVERVLNNNNFEIAIKTVKTYNDNTTLRLKNVNSDFSINFKDTIVGNARPIVLARGLWSNLLTWNEFGKELAFDENNARDTWLIEITGGDTTECSTCPNYKYEDLADYYWPALITGVQNYSAQKTLDYIGFSNGCRVALDSLRNWSSTGKTNAGYVFDSSTGLYISSNLGNNPISTFIGVACPGAFNGTSTLTSRVKSHPDTVAKLTGNNHPNFRDIAKTIEFFGFISPKNNPISLNTWDKYVYWILNSSDTQPGKGFNLSTFYLLYGTLPNVGFGTAPHDLAVTEDDQLVIFSNVNATTKSLFRYSLEHEVLPDDKSVKEKIKKLIGD